jgi:glycosyltransferase involved in cell wall biosynthesis
MEPVVSVLLKAYNHERFIAKAIESVLMQRTEFPFELVLAEDCSDDRTREICDSFARREPNVIRLLPSDMNWGMVGNMQKQVRFLDERQDYGLVYTDMESIAADGQLTEDEALLRRRNRYSEGIVFFDLLRDNFINTCTVLVRGDVLRSIERDGGEKYWFIYDHWIWASVAIRSRIGFLPIRTAHYRIHPGGISRSPGFLSNTKRQYYFLHDIVGQFDRLYSWPISPEDKQLLFRKMMSLLYRNDGTWRMKAEIARLMPKYYPGIAAATRILENRIFHKAGKGPV